MINVLVLLLTIFVTVETYNRLVFNNTTEKGGPIFKYYNLVFLNEHLLAKNSKYNKLFFGTKCCERRPRIDINCVFAIWEILLCLSSIIFTILFFVLQEMQLFFVLNICSCGGALLLALFSEQHLDSLLRKTRLIQESMAEQDLLEIKRKIEDEWLEFFKDC